MKKVVIVTMVLLFLILAYIVFYALTLKSSVTLNYKLKGVNIRNILKKSLTLTLDLYATNTSSNTIKIKDIYFEVYYLNKMVAKTPKSNNVIDVRSHQTNMPVLNNLNIDLFVNTQTAAMLADYIAKKPLRLKIKLKARIFFIPVNIITDLVYNDYQKQQ